jgi:hypothetical protein
MSDPSGNKRQRLVAKFFRPPGEGGDVARGRPRAGDRSAEPDPDVTVHAFNSKEDLAVAGRGGGPRLSALTGHFRI